MITISCSKQSNNNDDTGNTDPEPGSTLKEAGYGASNKPFINPSWSLPTGVELTDSIHEYSYCWAFPPGTSVPAKDWKGIPTGFTFCISLANTTNAPITIVFPPELVLVSSSVEHQNVVIIDMGELQMAPGITTTIVAQGFCLNKGRSIPESYIDGTEQFLSYSFGPSQIPAALKEVTGIVASKHITMDDVLKENGTIDNSKMAKYIPIQTAIWEVTDEHGLTEATRKALSAL